MFSSFPVKPTTPSRAREFNLNNPTPRLKEFKPPPKPLKRGNRVARVYEPKSPTPRSPASPAASSFFRLPLTPEPAHTQERPAPILNLPGLPDVELPRSGIVRDEEKGEGGGFAGSFLKGSQNIFGKIRPLWKKEPKLKIPPTPTSPQWDEPFIPPVKGKMSMYDDEAPKVQRKGTLKRTDSLKRKDTLKKTYSGVSDDAFDPPPLYTKHAKEGGISAYRNLVGAFLLQFCTIGYMLTWNVYEDHYTHVFMTDQNPIAIRFIGSIQWFLAFFVSLAAGMLTDKGFFRIIVAAGSAIFAASLIVLSFAPEEMYGLVFVLQSIGMGIGMGLVFVPTTILPTFHFNRFRGLTIGIVMSGGSFGGMVFPAALRACLPKMGFKKANLIVGVIAAVFLIIGNGVMVTPPKPEKPSYPLPRLDIAKYSKEKEYLFAAGGMFLASLLLSYPAFYLELMGLDHGVNDKAAFATVIVLSFFGIVGRAGLGFASDKVGSWNLLIPVNGILMLILFLVCTVSNTGTMIAASMFYGIFSAAWWSLTVTALVTLASRQGEIGVRVGLIFTIGSFGQLFSALIQDLILTPKFNWVIPSVLIGISFIGLTALAFLSRKNVARKQPYRKRRYFKLESLPIQLRRFRKLQLI